jgi:hypothetical protein
LKAGKGWRRRFVDPIPLPRGRQLVTLEDAGDYITKLANWGDYASGSGMQN